MFDSGINRLLDSISAFESLPADEMRALLTSAFVEVVGLRDVKGSIDPELHLASVRRLATALELHVVLGDDLGSPEATAAAFVAAEALELAADLEALLDDPDGSESGVISPRLYAAMEAGSLYLIAGFDANAAVAARAIDVSEIRASDFDEADAAARAAWSIRRFLEMRAPPQDAIEDAPEELRLPLRNRWEIFGRIASHVDDQLLWLIKGNAWEDRPSTELDGLSERIGRAGRYQDQALLARLLAAACTATEGRALRSVQGPESATWTQYVDRRSRNRPLLWPAALEYAETVLQDAADHAVVSVPTGAGKSSVAELAIANALTRGWILYLTPTNALAAQVVRDLSHQFAETGETEVKGYLGGAEYTELPGEGVEDVQQNEILVMTPEKCSLALRQQPEIFQELALLVMDECHLIGEAGSRGVTAELAVSEVLHRAPKAKVLLLSALVANPNDLASWLEGATERAVQVIDDPWRPTRTLRALLCIDRGRAGERYTAAKQFLEERDSRTNRRFEAPVSLLANYQGAWETTDIQDYGVLPSELSVPLWAVKAKDGKIKVKPGSYVNQAAGRVTAELAKSGQRVLTFLPANKHYSFSVAEDMPDLEPQGRSDLVKEEVDALLDLAEYELGVPSLLRGLLDKGVAVHTGAMLADEQRASELAFAGGWARALFATGTLAQGLNLPATAVVLGGTRVGDDRGMTEAAKEEAVRSQLLNALGRVGRAYVASRSIGIVIPDKWISITDGGSVEEARERAPFLAYPDASTEVRSRIQPLIRTALDSPQLQIGQLTSEEEAAFTFLSGTDREDSGQVLRKSYGAFREGLDDARAQEVSESLGYAGAVFVEEVEAPDWIVEASYVSGIALPAMGALYQALGKQLADGVEPEVVAEWRKVLTTCIGDLPWGMTSLLLPKETMTSTRMEELVESAAPKEEIVPPEAVQALDASLAAWMSGVPLTDIAEPALGKEPGAPGRSSGNALPKLIALTAHGFGFGVARIAGGLAALVSIGTDHEDEVLSDIQSDAWDALDLLPVALRFGCDGPRSTAWYRWGFRRRRLAHLLADVVPPPDGLEGEELAQWIRAERRKVLDGDYLDFLDANGVSVVEALVSAEG
jgi:hypothetical protein